MKNIFKKLDTLNPRQRATAIMSRWFVGVALWLIGAFCWPPFAGWSLTAFLIAVAIFCLYKLVLTIHDSLTGHYAREDHYRGRGY